MPLPHTPRVASTAVRRPSTARRLVSVAAAMLVSVTLAGVEPNPRALAAASPAVQGAGVTVVRGGTLIDGTGAAAVRDAIIVMEGGRITAVGNASLATPAGATVVEAAGKFIVPGLIDTHVHYRDWLGEMFLAHGVTSVFDLGDPTDWILAAREAERQGLLRGPRLYVSGNILDGLSRGGRATMGGAGARERSRRNRTLVGTEEAARRETRALIARGVDFIKVYQELELAELAAVADEAHKAGLVVLGHTYDATAATAAGMDVITHLWGVASTLMTPDGLAAFHAGKVASPYPALGAAGRGALARTLAAKKAYVNPLLVNEHAGVNAHSEANAIDVHRLLGDPALRYVPDDPRLGLLLMFTKVRNYATQFGGFPPLSKLPSETQQEFRDGYVQAQAFVREFAAAGGRLLAGTDSAGASITPGLGVHHELQLLVDAGISPMQALMSATKYAGELVASRDGVGTIEPGKRADLVVLDADPLADIGNTRRIAAVIKDGRRVDTTYHAHYASSVPYPILEFSSSYVPEPVLGDIAPQSAPAGSGEVKLAVTGAGFYVTAVVQVAGRPLTTTFISPTRVEAVIPAAWLRAPATLPVAVSNPRPGGGVSNAYGFVVAPRPGATGSR